MKRLLWTVKSVFTFIRCNAPIVWRSKGLVHIRSNHKEIKNDIDLRRTMSKSHILCSWSYGGNHRTKFFWNGFILIFSFQTPKLNSQCNKYIERLLIKKSLTLIVRQERREYWRTWKYIVVYAISKRISLLIGKWNLLRCHANAKDNKMQYYFDLSSNQIMWLEKGYH